VTWVLACPSLLRQQAKVFLPIKAESRGCAGACAVKNPWENLVVLPEAKLWPTL
jgi:hypothetical protein